MRRPVLFLDDSGVLNDHGPRPKEWERLVAEFFAPRLGGSRVAWAQANRVVMDRLSPPEIWNGMVEAYPDYRSFDHAYCIIWLAGMCEHVGIATPSDEECIRLGREADAYVSRRICSPLPRAIETVRELHALGYTLHTASGHGSIILDGYLEAMGIRDCFGRLYGPDLANAHKASPAYYERAFEDAGVRPEHALVVDDSPSAASWAVAAGARAVLVGSGDESAAAHNPSIERIGSLADLPRLLGERSATKPSC